MSLRLVFCFPFLFIVWAITFPSEALAIVEDIKGWLNELIIKQIVCKETLLLREQFRKWGISRGCNRRLIDNIFEEHSSEILQKLEAQYSQFSIDEFIERKS